jgi:hypothetical protein
VQLQRLLEGINAQRDQESAIRAAVLRALVEGQSVSLGSSAFLNVRRAGRKLIFSASGLRPGDKVAFLLQLINLLGSVGVDRVRKCHYVDPDTMESCDRWFIAKKRQLACSLEHAQRIRYFKWKERGMPRGTRGGKRRTTRLRTRTQ